MDTKVPVSVTAFEYPEISSLPNGLNPSGLAVDQSYQWSLADSTTPSLSDPSGSATLSVASTLASMDHFAAVMLPPGIARAAQSMPTPRSGVLGQEADRDLEPNTARGNLNGLLQSLSFSSLPSSQPEPGLLSAVAQRALSMDAVSFDSAKRSPASSGSDSMTPQAASLSRLLEVMARASVGSADNGGEHDGKGSGDYFSYVPRH